MAGKRKKAAPSRPAFTRELGAGSSGVDVLRLQTELIQSGYLAPLGPVPPQATPLFGRPAAPHVAGRFDKTTTDALRRFQEFHGLRPTGRFDAPTAGLMSQPRCGTSTAEVRLFGYRLQGYKWAKNPVTWHVRELTKDLTKDQILGALRAAFAQWSKYTSILFTETKYPKGDIEIRCVRRDHGDGSPFKAGTTIIAHAAYPPPNGLSGDIHFNDDFEFTDDPNAEDPLIDFQAVALHEIGHAIGMYHATSTEAVMYEYHVPGRRSLTSDDVAGVRQLYGSEYDQFNWRRCGKCLGLCFTNRGLGPCPGGGRHQPDSASYALPIDPGKAKGQHEWRWCAQCQGLWYGKGKPAPCIGGPSHVKSDSPNYTLAFEDQTKSGETRWRWCSRCQGLWYAPSLRDAGRCPATNNVHSLQESGKYRLNLLQGGFGF